MTKKLKMGMVGGGQGAFIGAVHRFAAALDGEIELVCGAFSSEPNKALASGKELGIPDNRNYPGFQEMFAAEQRLPENERMDFVAIVTPNHMHFPVACAALESGFHVICDKPATLNLGEAKELSAIVANTGLLFGLTHTYTGYPMVKEARQIVADGKLGNLRKVIVEYTQGWLTEAEDSNNKQAAWRTNPKTSGISGCMGDIGSHAANLAEYISSETIEQLCAELTTFVPGRLLDDDGMALMKMSGGIKGILHASQVACGEENNLTIRAYGDKGGLEWRQQEPNSLVLKWLNEPMQIMRTGGNNSALATANTRTPMGHPEGYLEAFANIYRNFVLAVQAHKLGKNSSPKAFDYPGIEDGVHGMAIIESLVNSHNSNEKWLTVNS
ncbi:Gfo/Idh/MocA family oxidoreductase [Thalassotalea fonticola]|uniref:Gfo/Idh/MocA family oxidoreductase n=1 Tax=Thalassotalea fonticola TaxID=3065649 RepID=A0ABZ0GJX7_9GAMM|nr:Gfo/Idh/MocA family oxidoreductase [Colwelliaceae bacterium S1-1]